MAKTDNCLSSPELVQCSANYLKSWIYRTISPKVKAICTTSSLPDGTREKASKHIWVGKQWGVRALPCPPGITNTILLQIQIQIQIQWAVKALPCPPATFCLTIIIIISITFNIIIVITVIIIFIVISVIKVNMVHVVWLSEVTAAPQKRYNDCSGDCVHQQYLKCHIWWFLWGENYVTKYISPVCLSLLKPLSKYICYKIYLKGSFNLINLITLLSCCHEHTYISNGSSVHIMLKFTIGWSH